jgi:hypothetical protein
MGNYLKMQMADKETLCQNIYTDEIERTAQYLKDYEQYAKVGKKDIPVNCYTNFRDALFHFRKLVGSVEEHEVMQQAFAIREHLHRARTDARITVLSYYADIANRLLNDKTISNDLRPTIRILLHKMKNIILSNRIDGMMMSDVQAKEVSEEDVVSILCDFFDLVQEQCFEQFDRLNDEKMERLE